MKKPIIKLTNIKFFEGHDTMIGFNADVHINGIKCFHVHDSAHGGCYEYQNYTYNNPKAEQVKANIKLLNDYIETLPEKDIEVGGGKILKLKVDMDVFIEDYVEAHQKEKERKKMEKRMKTAFLIGIPNNDRYSYIDYKRPLSSLPKPWLQGRLDAIVKKHCSNGNVILNTNLNELGLSI